MYVYMCVCVCVCVSLDRIRIFLSLIFTIFSLIFFSRVTDSPGSPLDLSNGSFLYSANLFDLSSLSSSFSLGSLSLFESEIFSKVLSLLTPVLIVDGANRSRQKVITVRGLRSLSYTTSHEVEPERYTQRSDYQSVIKFCKN